MLPRELAASSATGVEPGRHPDSHPSVVAAASAAIVCFPQFATGRAAPSGRESSADAGNEVDPLARPSGSGEHGRHTSAIRDHGEGRGDGYSEGVRLAVGDVVVYGAHGVGHVVARERRVVLGTVQEILVLELADGLSVTLPVERTSGLLRPLLSET